MLILFFQTLFTLRGFTKRRRAYVLAAFGALLLGVSTTVVLAAAGGPGGPGDVTTALTPIANFFCSIARFARTNLAYAVIVGALIIGGLIKAGGSQFGVRLMQGALIGAFVVLIAPPVITAIIGATGGTCTIGAAGG